MTEQIGSESLEIEVTDFGPIVKAKVDLRPLTVFVGPSNTGKSYLAILIYGLHRVFGGGPYLGRRHFRNRSWLRLGWGSRNLSEEIVSALLDLANSFSKNSESAGQDSIVLPPPVAEALRSGFGELADALSGEIGRCFGVGEAHALIRRGHKKSCVTMRRPIFGQLDLAEHTISLARYPEFRAMVPANIPIPIDSRDWDGMSRLLRSEGMGSEARRKFAAWEILPLISSMVLPSLVGPLCLPAFYLPADRTGIMHAHSVVVSALIASAPAAGLRPATHTPMLSGVLADFLEQLIEIDQFRHSRQMAKRDLGESIEKAILDGSIHIDRSSHTDYPRFAYRPRGWGKDLALANASSMVSELAPVVLYLRHVIEPGNVLIVEEPESHLHPAMQVAFTRQLAALVAAGVRVIVTTHSEWLLEELANIVRRSELSEADRGDNIALRPDQVGAWLFEPKSRPKGSIVKEIRLEESGFYPSGFDEVASVLHNEWASITSRIEANS